MNAKPATPIADLVETLLASGTAGEVIVLTVRAAEIASRAKRGTPARGSRLPADWRPSQADIEFAREKGMHPARIETEAERFRNYWTAKSGAAAVKLDWPATWRNWVLRASETSYGNRNTGALPYAGRAPAGSNAVIAGMGNLAASRRAARNAAGPSDGKMARSADTPRQLTAFADLDR